MAQVNHKQNIFSKAYHFRGRLWGKSYRTIVAGTQQIDGTWKHLRKWRPMSMLLSWTWRHNAALLQSLASALPQALWYWSVEKTKKLDEWLSAWYDSDDWKSWISNVSFLTLEEQNRVTAQAKRTFSLLSHTPANRNECPCCKHFLTTPANTSILSLSLKNQNFKFVTLTRAPSQPVALSDDTRMIWRFVYISLTGPLCAREQGNE